MKLSQINWAFLAMLLFTIVFWGLLVIAFLSLSGCSINSSKESLDIPVTMPDGTEEIVTYRSEIWQGLFLYFTKAKEVHKNSLTSELYVGELENYPDPNSVKAVSEGVVEALLK